MSKRSRSLSSSPPRDETVSDSTGLPADLDDLHVTKLVAYDMPTVHSEKHVMQCSLPPHSGSIGFTSLEDFEVHYAKEHANRCVECGRNLPSVHFLNLHIDENHNPVRETLAAKGEKTYACFVSECEKKCSTPQKRRLHMIDKHGYPKVYNFRVINEGIDNAKTMLQEGRRRRVSVTNDQSLSYRLRGTSISKPAAQGPASVTGAINPDIRNSPSDAKSQVSIRDADLRSRPNGELSATSNQIDDLSGAFAALHFVPRSVASKHGKGHS